MAGDGCASFLVTGKSRKQQFFWGFRHQSAKMAWNSIASNKMRSFLTMLGIIIGVASLIVLVSIADGAIRK